MDKSIQHVDFGAARWQFWAPGYGPPGETIQHGPSEEAQPVRLHDGSGTGDFYGYQARYQLVGKPVFADVDDDHVQEAAVQLRQQFGNDVIQAWYVWVWRHGKAVQLPRPVAVSSRCGGAPPDITADKDGFVLKNGSAYDGGTACVGAGADTPVSATISVRGDYAVTVKPRLGPTEICSPRLLTSQLRPTGKVTPRVAPDMHAAKIGKPRTVKAVLTQPENASSEQIGSRIWDLALLQDSSGEQACAWINGEELGSDAPG